MNVLILANVSMWVYKLRKEIIEELIDTDNEVYISAIRDEFTPELVNMGCKFIDTQIDKQGTNPSKDIKLMSFYIRTIKSINPNVVLTYTIKPNIYGGMACSLLGKKYVSTVAGLGNGFYKSNHMLKLVLLLYKMGLRKSKCIFFQNEENKKFFADNKVLRSKVKLVPGSGVNLDYHKYEQYPDSDDKITLLFIGRVMKEKGIEELLSGAKILKKQYHVMNFSILGGMDQDYSRILNEYEELDIVKYHGKKEDVRGYIKDAHAVILPSYHEGMANVLLEAASSGRPILASKVSGCVETFDEGVSGLGFEAKDVDSLCNTVDRFVKLTLDQKKAMGIAGRKKMKQEFDRNIVVKSYMEEIQG